jgi:hypothetical protein
MSLCSLNSITYYVHLSVLHISFAFSRLNVRHGVIRHIIDGQQLPLSMDHSGVDNRGANQTCWVDQPVYTSSLVRNGGMEQGKERPWLNSDRSSSPKGGAPSGSSYA